MKRLVLCACALTLVAAGCAKKQIVKPVTDQETTAPAAEPQAKATPRTEPSIRFADWESSPDLKNIYFDYDKSELLPEARATLQKNADYLKANAGLSVLVEGHTDERGTTEYNLSLGQRRAMAVREYYGQLGVATDKIGTISFGEEKPLEAGQSESSWSKNRRAETKVRGVVKK